MKYEEIIKLITYVWNAEGKMPTLVSPKGSGKTSLARAIADRNGWKFKQIILSTKEAIDMEGMPYVVDGEVHKTYPDWYQDIHKHLTEHPEAHVLVLWDEIHDAPTEVRNAMKELILHHVLPDGTPISPNVHFMGAMNTEQDSEGFVDFGGALQDRLFMISYKPDVDEWHTLFKDNFGSPQTDREKEIRTKLSKFLAINPHLLENRKPVSAKTYGITEEAEAKVIEYNTPNRRNWDNLARLMAQTQDDAELKHMQKTMFISTVGMECWRNYKEYISTENKPLSTYKWDGEPDEISQQVNRLKAETNVDKQAEYFVRAHKYCQNKEVVASLLPDILKNAISKYGIEYRTKLPEFYEIYQKIGA